MLQATHLLKNLALKSNFHTRAQPLLKASIMEMPAMSPTMTEGGIVEWKFKPGEAFSSGDVLLEVETDKATIDVEALDDGVMGKIVIDNGAKNIKVGSPIAVLAEEDDDLSALDFDAILSSKKSAAAPAAKEAPAKEEAPVKKEAPAKKVSSPVAEKKSEPISADGIFTKANKKQVLYPSVSSLLHSNNISEAKALEEIPASGPNGRLLKGDVLLYLNKIDKNNYIKLNKFIKKNSVLDLSNIQLRQPVVTEKKPAPLPVVLQLEKVVKPTTKSISEILKELQKEVHAPKQQQPSVFNDPIFEELISTRYSEPIFNYKFTLAQVTKAAPKTQQYDLFDELIGAPLANNVVSTPANESNDLKLNVVVDLGFNPKQDVLNKANDFISKVNNL
ncbi:hypothetical protein ACO0OE_001180 [Hanseniaspora uvarum]